MDKNVFAEIMRKIKYAYGDRFQELSSGVLNTWYESLKDESPETLSRAVIGYIQENKYPPTICDLYQRCRIMAKEKDDGWQ